VSFVASRSTPIFSRELRSIVNECEGETDCSGGDGSESSMFVWPHKLILKTCGTTTLLFGLKTILRIASEQCDLNAVWRCFYSRKAFMFPEKQVGPHRDWFKEVEFLNDVFGPCGPPWFFRLLIAVESDVAQIQTMGPLIRSEN
jgi:hypothetical protein